jgi:hypothetical protein
MNQVRDLRYAARRSARVGHVPRPTRVDQVGSDNTAGADRRPQQPSTRRTTAPPSTASTTVGTAGTGRPQQRAALTLLGVGMLNVLVSCLGAALDMMATNSVEVIFGFLFAIGSLATVWLVRRADLVWSLVVPPIGYVAGLAVAVQLGANKLGVSLVTKIASVLTLLALDPVPLFVGMLIAVLAVIVRLGLGKG